MPKPKGVLPKQRLGLLPSVLTFLLTCWAGAQIWIEQSSSFSVNNTPSVPQILDLVFRAAGTAYVYTDYWLWLLHCFLDRVESQTSKIGIVRSMAIDFQEHHDKPTKLLTQNHLGDIDDLVNMTMATGLMLGPWTSPRHKLFAVSIVVWGALGGLNHFYCHVRTNRYKVPHFYQFCQDYGLLPTAQHHKNHHTLPFDANWNFLNGFHRVYEAIYFSTGASYAGLYVLFALSNPMTFQTWVFAVSHFVIK